MCEAQIHLSECRDDVIITDIKLGFFSLAHSSAIVVATHYQQHSARRIY